MRISPSFLRPAVLGLALALGSTLGLAAPAAAHGPTVRVTWSAVKPAKLTIRVGDTVHFTNATASGSPCTVVADDGSFTSPTLGRAEGWHHTFEKPGTFVYHVQEMSSARGTVVVVGSTP
jgi:plastocyanin